MRRRKPTADPRGAFLSTVSGGYARPPQCTALQSRACEPHQWRGRRTAMTKGPPSRNLALCLTLLSLLLLFLFLALRLCRRRLRRLLLLGKRRERRSSARCLRSPRPSLQDGGKAVLFSFLFFSLSFLSLLFSLLTLSISLSLSLSLSLSPHTHKPHAHPTHPCLFVWSLKLSVCIS